MTSGPSSCGSRRRSRVVAFVILGVTFQLELVLAGLFALGVLPIADNLGELRRQRRIRSVPAAADVL